MFKYSNIRHFTCLMKNDSLRKISSTTVKFNETCIYALASGSQRAGLAVVRVSGKSSYNILADMTNKPKINVYEPRKMYLKEIINPITKEKIDKGLVVWFKGINIFLKSITFNF